MSTAASQGYTDTVDAEMPEDPSPAKERGLASWAAHSLVAGALHKTSTDPGPDPATARPGCVRASPLSWVVLSLPSRKMEL